MRAETKPAFDVKGAMLVLIVLILTAISAYPQSAFTGRVVEVVDGRTFVIEVPNAKIRGVLQYVEVPEPEQALFQTVKDHLSGLILGRIVEFKPLGFNTQQTVGKLTVGGIDVGQQMLRDGAAWHSVLQKNGQGAAERLLYEQNEAQAKAEKRGIWGVSDLLPPWEFRAEKERAERERQRKEYERAALLASNRSVKTPARPTSTVENYADFNAWSDIRQIDSLAGTGGIISKYDSARRLGYHLTTQAQVNVTGAENPPYLDVRVIYGYGYTSAGNKRAVWAIAVWSDANDYKFAKSNNLTLTVGDEKLALGKAYRFFGDTGAARRESLIYIVNRSTVQKIAAASDVRIKVGAFNGALGNKLQSLSKNLLAIAE